MSSVKQKTAPGYGFSAFSFAISGVDKSGGMVYDAPDE